jgi:hypothetical protein
VKRSAEISPCGKYRWWLRRSWQFWKDGQPIAGKGVCCFVMLNPSTADAEIDDPTIRRCMRFAYEWGYDTLSVRNLSPYRATHPDDLRELDVDELTGSHRGQAEILASVTADLLVCAWGAGVPHSLDKIAMDLLSTHFPAKSLFCLGKTKHGFPRHPLYVRSDKELEAFECVR